LTDDERIIIPRVAYSELRWQLAYRNGPEEFGGKSGDAPIELPQKITRQ
jgi:hypothetical protein